jgi:hypothetical protein
LVNGKEASFTDEELHILSAALSEIGDEIKKIALSIRRA